MQRFAVNPPSICRYVSNAGLTPPVPAPAHYHRGRACQNAEDLHCCRPAASGLRGRDKMQYTAPAIDARRSQRPDFYMSIAYSLSGSPAGKRLSSGSLAGMRMPTFHATIQRGKAMDDKEILLPTIPGGWCASSYYPQVSPTTNEEHRTCRTLGSAASVSGNASVPTTGMRRSWSSPADAQPSCLFAGR